MNVEPATLKRLAEIDNIVGVKEASGNIAQMARIRDPSRPEPRRALRRRLLTSAVLGSAAEA